MQKVAKFDVYLNLFTLDGFALPFFLFCSVNMFYVCASMRVCEYALMLLFTTYITKIDDFRFFYRYGVEIFELFFLT